MAYFPKYDQEKMGSPFMKNPTMPATHVLALDPGKATGWAFIDLATGQFSSGEAQFEEITTRIGKAVETYGAGLQIVAERFIIGPQTHKNSQAPWSLEMIGVAKYFAGKTDCPLVLTSASEAKNFSFNGRLKALGWYKGGAGHADDASRHLLLHLVTRRKWWDERLDATID